MLIIGSHVGMGANEYYLGSVKEALSYDANTFMFYTGAPQNSIRTPLERLKIDEALNLMKDNGIDVNNVVVHAPYLINLGNMNKEKYDVSLNMLKIEIDRTAKMGCRYLVLHPGASMDYDRNESILQVASLLNEAISTNDKVIILLETMAGKGSEIGKTFEELKMIIDNIDKKDQIGVCLDTCHIHDGGYDLSNFDDTLDEFDKIIGLSYLRVVHVNDSKNERGAHKDRHENIGFGKIGFDNIINVIYNPRICDRIFILETPYVKEKEGDKNSYPPYKFEINTIRNKVFEPDLLSKIVDNYK